MGVHSRLAAAAPFDVYQAALASAAHAGGMTSREVKPMRNRHLALAALVAAAFASPIALADTSPAKEKQAAIKPSGLQKITLSTGLKDGEMVFLDEKGQANPKL